VVISLGSASRKVGLAGIGEQARRATWAFLSARERGKEKRMEKLLGNWGASSNIAEGRAPNNIGEGITSLAGGTGTAIGVLKQFIIGRQVTGSFLKRLSWDLLAVGCLPLLALAGIVMSLTH